MAASFFPDIWTWIQGLPPISQWEKNYISTPFFASNSPPNTPPSLKLSISKNPTSTSISLSLMADYNIPISLWTSKPLKINRVSSKLFDPGTISDFLTVLIESVLSYSPIGNNSFKLLSVGMDSVLHTQCVLNFVFLTLAFLVCIYEGPTEIRLACLDSIKNQLACPNSREVSRTLMRAMGSEAEERWMRAVNLGITNWVAEIRRLAVGNHGGSRIKTPSPLFSYSVSTSGLWKVQVYCPVVAMEVEAAAAATAADERLMFSLNHQQVEGVIQLNYKVVVGEKWNDVIVNVDNIRCDVFKLVNDTLMTERGAGASEKHFPSRISLHLTPADQTHVLTVSVAKSSDNPPREIGLEKTVEGSFDPTNHLGLKVSAAETVTVTVKPWKFEQSVCRGTAVMNWFLHDSGDGREVFSSKPSKFAMLRPGAWFKNRYSNVHRPFTRQGGVVFAGDEYGESVCWKVERAAGKVAEWEVKGWIWVTYWPNKHRTFYTETRRLEFREMLQLKLV